MTPIPDHKVEELETKANEIRTTIIKSLINAKSGHTAGPLGMTDIFTTLYFHILNHDPKNPLMEDRDRLILSNGHIVPVRYAAMAHVGYFPVKDVEEGLRHFGSDYQGHPERMRIPALETTSGPLGSGLGQAAGIALAAKMDGKKFFTYCLMSDGEQQAGNTWEAAMFAGANKLGNLIGVIDRNNIQINGKVEETMPLEPFRAKYESFGWHVMEVDGHNIERFSDAVDEAKAISMKPVCIIANTIPGKGIDEIEGDYRWHGAPPGKGPEDVWPKGEQGKEMLDELRRLSGEIEASHLD